MEKNNKKGFTLIELLVVISIIGLLASIVLVSVQGARDRAKDARVMSNMNQFRSQATIIGDTNSGSFANVACSSVTDSACTCTDSQIDILCEDLIKNDNQTAGVNPVVRVGGTGNITYCAYVRMQGASNNYWCVDYKFISKGTYTSAPATCGVGCTDCRCE